MPIKNAQPVRIQTAPGEFITGLECEGMFVGGSWASGLEDIRENPRHDHASIAQFIAATALPDTNL